jgi:DNA-binding PucR family transcriptional regulator
MGDYARTAAALNVHENTVRYRIRRAQDLYGIAFDDPDTVLVTWLQLRLAGIRETGRP